MNYTRTNNDKNGNPRYLIHFTDCETAEGRALGCAILARKKMAVANMKKFGGRAYRGKDFGGGIVFQSYDIEGLVKSIETYLEGM